MIQQWILFMNSFNSKYITKPITLKVSKLYFGSPPWFSKITHVFSEKAYQLDALPTLKLIRLKQSWVFWIKNETSRKSITRVLRSNFNKNLCDHKYLKLHIITGLKLGVRYFKSDSIQVLSTQSHQLGLHLNCMS